VTSNKENAIINEYFEWLYNLVCRDRYSPQISHRKLISRLHCIEFRYSIPKDGNRAEDGIKLRYRFALRNGYEKSADIIMDILDGPCSVLEMLIALALKCEEDIMDDPKVGDRTTQWFWGMLTNLGLGGCRDELYERSRVDNAIERFLNRDYEPDGRGGLFTIRNCEYDLRDVEIWYQLCWYLDTIT
jgi:hypothetical protein